MYTVVLVCYNVVYVVLYVYSYEVYEVHVYSTVPGLGYTGTVPGTVRYIYYIRVFREDGIQYIYILIMKILIY